jgi:sugar lactone lactonase YvrE
MVGTPRLLLDDLVFAEGPRWHDGRLWFSDIHAHEVVAVDLEGRRETLLTVPARPSGLGFLPDGRLLVIGMADRRVLRLDPGGAALHADISGLAAFCNDMVVDGRGRAYVDNDAYDLFSGAEYRPGSLVLVTPDGQARTVAEDLAFPNGLVVTPDGRTLIAAESRGPRLTAFAIADDGSLSERREWAPVESSPDGICLDAEGCVWVSLPRAPGGFVRLAQGGEVRDRVALEQGWLGIACALGGPERKTLFLLEARTARPAEMSGRGNSRIRVVEVEMPGAGWP